MFRVWGLGFGVWGLGFNSGLGIVYLGPKSLYTRYLIKGPSIPYFRYIDPEDTKWVWGRSILGSRVTPGL